MSPRLLGDRLTVRQIRDELDAIACELSDRMASDRNGMPCVVEALSYTGQERLRELRLALDQQLLREGDGLAAQ